MENPTVKAGKAVVRNTPVMRLELKPQAISLRPLPNAIFCTFGGHAKPPKRVRLMTVEPGR